jgi:outer membrane protein OmpA-like peptidoglycan-associated protein
VPDDIDKCPDEAEDKDLIMDLDGCPETDADEDKIPDEKDECPLDAEDIDLDSDEDGCPDLEPEAALTADRIEINQRILFEFGRAIVRPESIPILDAVARILDENPSVRLRVEGHTDSEGPSAVNHPLSQARAVAVRAILLSRSATKDLAERITIVGFGPDRPRATNDTEGGRAHNRRVEFIIAKDESQ